jgi:hypothetical protein
VLEQIRTVLNDILFVFLLGLATIIFAMIYHLNPPGEEEKEEVKSPGNLIAELRWFPDDLNCDVDLWVQGPGSYPVGYSNLRGRVWNLLRDDLGHGANYNDYLGLNYEHAFTRGFIPGNYTVNAHLYRCKHTPVQIKLQVMFIGKKTGKKIIHTGEYMMTRHGQELTLIRFTLDEHGNDSNHHAVYIPLRTGATIQ